MKKNLDVTKPRTYFASPLAFRHMSVTAGKKSCKKTQLDVLATSFEVLIRALRAWQIFWAVFRHHPYLFSRPCSKGLNVWCLSFAFAIPICHCSHPPVWKVAHVTAASTKARLFQAYADCNHCITIGMLYIIIDLIFCLHVRRIILASGLTPAGELKIAQAYKQNSTGRITLQPVTL